MVTLKEAIKHCEDKADEQHKLANRYDDASGYTRSHNESIRTEEARKCEANADEYRLIAKWLKEYEQITSKENRKIFGWKKKQPQIEQAGNASIKFDTKAAKQYLKDNVSVTVEEVPLWVLISLGVMYVSEIRDEE